MKKLKGFILTAKTFDLHKKAITHIYCRGEDGPFLITIDHHRPLFFVERSAKLPRFYFPVERKEIALKTMEELPVDALYFQTQADLYTANRECLRKGVHTYESDIPTIERFLMERFINGSVEIEGDPHSHDPYTLKTFYNPQIKATQFQPKLTLLSLDIETSLTNDLYSIAFHMESPQKTFKKVLMIGEAKPTQLDYLEYCPDEKALLQSFIQIIQLWDPDIILGWNIVGFDLSFLNKKCHQYNIPMEIGRNRGILHLKERTGLMGWYANLDGRVILDGPTVLRGAFYQFENYKLDTVAENVLQRHKDIRETGIKKTNEITRRFHHDKESLAKYNLQDCTLVIEIFNKLHLIDMLLTRVQISGMLLDRIGLSTAAFDHFYLPRFHRKGYVAPNIADTKTFGHAAGGYVMDPEVGLHKDVIVLDFKSLYPSIIRTFHIDPLSNLKKDHDPITTPSNHQFSQTQHILPQFLEELLKKRERAKKNNDQHLSQAIKILMNSFYGVMGSAGSRFYHPNLPNAITGTGQWILKECISILQSDGYCVLYGDTDSVFVKLNESQDPFKAGKLLAVKLNRDFLTLIENKFHVQSYLEIEFEKYYQTFFLPHLRGGLTGAKKRYAGLQKFETGEEKMEFKGLEIIRSDWTQLAKDFQYEIFDYLFKEKDLTELIQHTVKNLELGIYDNKLIYKKRLTKLPVEYTKTRPPHIRAALILDPTGTKRIKSIQYIMTDCGPEPVGKIKEKPDYKHYIEKQLKPIADSVLFLFHQSFDNIIEKKQLSFFN